MSFSPQQTPHFNLGHFEREHDEEDCLQQFSRCPTCRQGYGVGLILPCSHPMCACCVATGERRRSHLRLKVEQNACTLLCHCCRGPVELPCWSWSSATSCLPEYPSMTSQCITVEGGVSSDQMKRGDKSFKDARDVELWGSSSSVNPPVDGSLDLQDEEMKQSVYGLRFALDPTHVPSSIRLSNSSLTATYQAESPPSRRASNQSVQPLPVVCGDVVIGRGQFYWEVDVCDSSIFRIGVHALNSSRGWWFERQGLCFSAVYDGTLEPIYNVPPWIKTIGLFLNIGGGVLSVHNAVSQEHLVTMPTRFDPTGVVPAFGLGQGRLRLRCGLPPPPSVFYSKDSAYRRAQGAGVGTWRRGIPFGSVKKVVQKFEELALSK